MKVRVSRDETDQRTICPQPSAVWARELRHSSQWNVWVLHPPATEIQPSSCSMGWPHTGRGSPSMNLVENGASLQTLDEGGCNHWTLRQRETDGSTVRTVRAAVRWGCARSSPQGLALGSPLASVFSCLGGLASAFLPHVACLFCLDKPLAGVQDVWVKNPTRIASLQNKPPMNHAAPYVCPSPRNLSWACAMNRM